MLEDNGNGSARRVVLELVSGTVAEGGQVGGALSLLSVCQHAPKYTIYRRFVRPFQFVEIRDNVER